MCIVSIDFHIENAIVTLQYEFLRSCLAIYSATNVIVGDILFSQIRNLNFGDSFAFCSLISRLVNFVQNSLDGKFFFLLPICILTPRVFRSIFLPYFETNTSSHFHFTSQDTPGHMATTRLTKAIVQGESQHDPTAYFPTGIQENQTDWEKTHETN
jgi:hypothetical protein